MQVSAPEPGLIPIPEQLRRGDGTSVLRPHRDQRYASVDQLDLENRIVALARAGGAVALTPAQLISVRVRCDAAGLTADQTAAVIGIVSSGRVGDVLIGPAGTGKSRTLGVLAHIWAEQTGARVSGLATSQIATLELTANGLEACNTTAFRHRAATAQPGSLDYPVRAGDLVVIDEVGMTYTADLAHITELVSRAGGKLLFTGDPEQLAAIEAGGMLGLLAADNGHYALDQVHRFDQPWEPAASLRLRAGDPEVLDRYEEHGRLRGGSAEELTEQAVRAYLADTLSGNTTLLVTATNDSAAQLSARIRAELVRLGYVKPEILGIGADGNPISIGDRVQARRNDPTITLGTGADTGEVTNRATYRVLGQDSAGVVVRDESGRTGVLPHDYVAEDLTLGYAVTVWAAQGRTVDTCHALITPSTARRGLYVALTRGRQSNTAYVVCERDGDEHHHEPLASNACAELAAILTRADDDTALTAEQTRRTGIAEARSLAWIVGQWDLLATEACHHDTDHALRSLLPAATVRTVTSEPGYQRLCRAIRAAEIVGHDPAPLLTDVIAQRSLFGADSLSDVLRWRIHTTTPHRTPERDPHTGWAAMTLTRPGTTGEYLDRLAAAAAHRQHELGHDVLRTLPAWATEHLAPPPEVPGERTEWVRRAGIIAAYRELAALPDTTVSLGGPPSAEQPLHRALWRQALTAAGGPADELDYTCATNHELQQMRAAYRRQLTWAPPYVHDELRDSRICAINYRNDATLWQAEADLLPAGSSERSRADRDVAAAQHLADYFAARVEYLEVIATARDTWHHDTEPDRTLAELAGDELARRGLPRDPAPSTVEQLTLLQPDPISEPAPQQVAHREPAAIEGRNQQQALLDMAPSAHDLAAAGPLHQDQPREQAQYSGSLSQIRRHAEILTALRAAHRTYRDIANHLEHITPAGRADHAGEGQYQAELAYYSRMSSRSTGRERDLAFDEDLGAGH